MSWRLAKSLIKLREQLNAAYPNRSKASDGALGDQAHASRASDHNPNAQGVVTAIDITHDPAHSVDGMVLSTQLTTDIRTKYCIFSGRIWKARTGKWEPYTGSNAHNHHVHVSVRSEVMDAVVPWPIGTVPPHSVVNATPPTLRLNARGEDVRRLQELLVKHGATIQVDGYFGYGTESAIKKFQAEKGLESNGTVSAATWAALSV